MDSYNKLEKLLIDKGINKKYLMKMTGITAITKLTKGQNLTTDVLCKICETLNFNFKDIIKYIKV